MSATQGLELALFGVACGAAGMLPGALLGKHIAQDSSRRALNRVAGMIDGLLDRGVVDERQLPASDRSYGYRLPSSNLDVRPARGSDADLAELDSYAGRYSDRPGGMPRQ